MFVVTRLRVPETDAAGFAAAVDVLLGALAARPGYRDGGTGGSGRAGTTGRPVSPGSPCCPGGGLMPRLPATR